MQSLSSWKLTPFHLLSEVVYINPQDNLAREEKSMPQTDRNLPDIFEQVVVL